MKLETINKYYNYSDFIQHTATLVENHSTSGNEGTEEQINFTALNQKRMERWNKTLQLSEEFLNILHNLKQEQIWVVITESWCGDSSQVLPVIAKVVAESNNKIELRIIFRDEHPEWIAEYHTNGSKSIPKLISFDKEGNQLFVWGPRPAAAIELFKEYKASNGEMSKEQFHVNLHGWYAKDKGHGVLEELNEILKLTDTSH
jgi:thioredoxin-like negative regulator of GroEL